jgi:hypothetical protein
VNLPPPSSALISTKREYMIVAQKSTIKIFHCHEPQLSTGFFVLVFYAPVAWSGLHACGFIIFFI